MCNYFQQGIVKTAFAEWLPYSTDTATSIDYITRFTFVTSSLCLAKHDYQRLSQHSKLLRDEWPEFDSRQRQQFFFTFTFRTTRSTTPPPIKGLTVFLLRVIKRIRKAYHSPLLSTLQFKNVYKVFIPHHPHPHPTPGIFMESCFLKHSKNYFS